MSVSRGACAFRRIVMEGMIMDSERFDGLVRSFGQTRSRRQTLRGLAGAVAVGAFAVGGREASAGTCKSDDSSCKSNKQCCSNNCAGKYRSTSGTCQAAAVQCIADKGSC